MNGDPLQPVSPGQPFRMRADTMNLMRQAVQAHAMSRHPRGGRPKLRPLLPGQVWITNASGAGRDRFNVLGLSNGVGNVSFDPTASQLDQFQRGRSCLAVNRRISCRLPSSWSRA